MEFEWILREYRREGMGGKLICNNEVDNWRAEVSWVA